MIGHLEADNDVVMRQQAALEAMLTSDPSTAERLRAIVSTLIKQARGQVSGSARSAMASDPRDAYKAVRNSVYKTIIGGQVNILNPRHAGGSRAYDKPRKLDMNPTQRGGNRRPRSARTEQVDGYYGKDRGFILRFVNNGVPGDRQTRYGRRGSIAPRNWFDTAASSALDTAAGQLAKIIESEMAAIYKEKANG